MAYLGAYFFANMGGRGSQNYLAEASLLTVGVILLTVELLCLQSLKALIRCTFPL